MGVTGIFFSPTGTTRLCARKVAEGMGMAYRELDLTLPRAEGGEPAFQEDEAVILAAPVYAGRIPALFAGRLEGIRGNGAKAVLLCNYGNRAYDDALAELFDLACARGFVPVAAGAFVSQHSFSNKIAPGRPDAQDMEKLLAFGAAAAKRLAAPPETALAVPGNRPYKPVTFRAAVPLPDEGCIQCGHCAAVCPSGAISSRDVSKVDGEACVGCHACKTFCPQGARKAPVAFADAVARMIAAFGQPKKEPEFFL